MYTSHNILIIGGVNVMKELEIHLLALIQRRYFTYFIYFTYLEFGSENPVLT